MIIAFKRFSTCTDCHKCQVVRRSEIKNEMERRGTKDVHFIETLIITPTPQPQVSYSFRLAFPPSPLNNSVTIGLRPQSSVVQSVSGLILTKYVRSNREIESYKTHLE